MKRISLIPMVIGLLLCLAQCKKDSVEPATPDLIGEKYPVSLTLGGKPDAKADVYPFDNLDIAPVYYSIGDKIQVVYKGIRVGEIECKRTDIPSEPEDYLNASADFEGEVTIDEIDGISPLYFYFLGNKPYGDTEGKFIVDISDQSDQLPVISYAASKEAFAADRTKYTIWNGYNHDGSNWLLNQCALVKFECENIYDMSANTNDNNPDAIYKTKRPVTIYGMDNHVEIDLSRPGANNQFVWSQVDGGAMTLRLLPSDTEGSARYAIVHHMDYTSVTAGQLEVPFNPVYDPEHPEDFDPYGFYGTYKIAHSVVQNEYFDGAKLDLVWHSGAFSIGTSEKVVFSRGNLQYAARGAADPNGTWRFAKHQYDFVGGLCEGTDDQYLGNVVFDENTSSVQMSDNTQVRIGSYGGWIDLFGWGTGNIPTEYNSINHFYTTDHHIVLVVPPFNRYGNNDRFHDWGENNIVNSGKPGNTSWWTTLSKNENEYLFDERNDANSKVGFGQIQVSENLTVNGLIILPDEWHISYYPTASGIWKSAGPTYHDYDNNVFESVANWMLMEAAGAVFLPAAGYRDTDDYGYSHERIEFDGGSGTHGQNQDRGTYYLSDLQGQDAAWGLGFGTASGDDLLIGEILHVQNLGNDHVNPKTGVAPDNGRSVRLAHRLGSSKSVFNMFNK